MTHRSLSVALSSVTAKSMFRITWRCVFVNMQSMRKCCSVRAECVHNLRVGDAQSRRWSRSRTTEYAEINLDKMENLSDGVMINYFSTALRNQYIAISVGRCRIRDNEIAYDQDSFGEMLEGNPQTETGMEDSILIETMKTTLTEREKLCVQRIVLEGWTAEALASALGITKQAVNQCKKRALEKLKKIYT